MRYLCARFAAAFLTVVRSLGAVSKAAGAQSRWLWVSVLRHWSVPPDVYRRNLLCDYFGLRMSESASLK